MNTEIWKPVLDWPEYEISSLGNVRRRGRSISIFSVKGYLAFNVCNKANRKSLRVHREVAKAFLPHEPNQVVRHLNGRAEDCRLENLAWGTAEENEMDKKRHGTAQVGERHNQHKLTEDQVRSIRASNRSRSELASLYGVTYRAIYAIQKGEIWRHI